MVACENFRRTIAATLLSSVMITIRRFKCIPFLFVLLLQAAVVEAQTIEDAATKALEAFQAADWVTAIADYSKIVADNPSDGLSWYRLGSSHHQLKNYDSAINAFVRSDSLGFAPQSSRYNIACGFARLNRIELGLEWLTKAIESGFAQVQTLETDTDLDNLRGEARFQDLVLRAKKQATPCLYDELYSAMDFWLGDWDVFVNGRLAGRNKITKVSDGCALLEDWTSSQGTTGMSLNFYDPSVSKWKQTWVGGYVGEYVEESHADGEILFGYESAAADGSPVHNRLLFKLQEDGSVRQVFSSSTDGGENWQVSFDGRYVKRTN